jgi:hypothetical protein
MSIFKLQHGMAGHKMVLRRSNMRKRMSALGHSLPICLVSASHDVRSTPKADIRFQRGICSDGPTVAHRPRFMSTRPRQNHAFRGLQPIFAMAWSNSRLACEKVLTPRLPATVNTKPASPAITGTLPMTLSASGGSANAYDR